MPTVKTLEEIHGVRGKKDRRTVVFDDAEPVELSLGIAAAAGLLPGATVTDKAVREALAEDRRTQAQSEALKLLARKDVTEKEMRTHLREFPADVADAVVAKCREWGYLDDQRFAQHLVNDSIELKKLGPARIRQALRRRGVPDDITEQAMGATAREDSDHVEQALRALRTKRLSYARLDPETARRRMYGFLQRRGFAFDTVRAAVDQMLGELETGEAEDKLPL
jgi:regulatory protein